MKTLSLKELQALQNSLLTNPKQILQEKAKNFSFDFFNHNSINSLDDFIEKHGFRGFNIDFQPRMIFSEAKSTDY